MKENFTNEVIFDEAKEIKNGYPSRQGILIEWIRSGHSTIFPLQGGNLYFWASLRDGMGRRKKSWVIIPHNNTSLFPALHTSILSWSIQWQMSWWPPQGGRDETSTENSVIWIQFKARAYSNAWKIWVTKSRALHQLTDLSAWIGTEQNSVMTVSHCRAEICFLDGISRYISAIGWLLGKFICLFCLFVCLFVCGV